MQLLSFGWGQDYLRAANTLLGSARRFSLPLTTIEISGQPSSPQEAKRLKPFFLKQWLKKGPVTWLDADSYIHKYPKILFQELDCDMAIYSPRKDVYWNGTLMLYPTVKTIEIMNEWENLLSNDDWKLDQVVLSNIIKIRQPNVFILPFSYHWMNESHSRLGSPIIEQYNIGKPNIGY